tara:strand:+ start:620 stop:2116 length:1497 start_codon:yes stop_codon:yes gene_type:complete
MKRNLSLRNYQELAVDEIINNNMLVLAACINSGKTEMTIAAIEKLIKLNPNYKVLVLTHSTNVILHNFYSRLQGLDVSFTYSNDLKDNCQVHLTLPNSENKITSKYDMVVVDEAHENYSATRVQRIINKVKPTRQLLLTATPAKFIGDNKFKIHVISANELPEEYMAKLSIELVESSYDWMKHYNNDNEVKASFVSTLDDTKETLEKVILKIIERLNYKYSPEQFNNPNALTKAKSWFNKKVMNWNKKSWGQLFTEIGKTMIVCKTIKHAELIKRVLDENDVTSNISHSENDKNSEMVVDFKNNKFEILIVVKRGILGYSDNDLMNIIDMSGTHNPNIIHQMFGRLFRGTPENQKYYVKLTPKNELDKGVTDIATCVALMLTDKKYLSTYNGRNMNDFKIPVRKIRLNKEEIDKDGNVKRNTTATTYLPNVVTMDIVRLFKDIIHDSNNDASIYKQVTIREVRGVLGYIRKTLTYKEVLESTGMDEETIQKYLVNEKI